MSELPLAISVKQIQYQLRSWLDCGYLALIQLQEGCNELINEERVFIIDYAPDWDIFPYFMDKKQNPKLPDFDVFNNPPEPDMFPDRYSLETKRFIMNANFLLEDNLISEELLSLCTDRQANCVSVPVTISFYKNQSFYFR